MKLKLSQIRKDLGLNISKGMSMATISELCDATWGDVIDFDVRLPSIGMNLQRPFVWSLEQKQQLVLSVLKGINIPKLSIISTGYHTPTMRSKNRTYHIIDGKQRLSTLIDFYRGLFHIEFEGNRYFFYDLEDYAQGVIMYFSFTADIVNEHIFEGKEDHNNKNKITDQQKIDWFEQINFSGTVHDEQHMERLKGVFKLPVVSKGVGGNIHYRRGTTKPSTNILNH